MRRIGVVVGWVLLLSASAAVAQTRAEKDRAKAHFRQGQGHFNLREFPEALADFKEAYRLTNDPNFLFNIGQCQYKLADLSGALYSYRAYLRNGKDVPNRAEVETRIKEIESRLATATTAPPPTTPVVTQPSPAAAPDSAPPPSTTTQSPPPNTEAAAPAETPPSASPPTTAAVSAEPNKQLDPPAPPSRLFLPPPAAAPIPAPVAAPTPQPTPVLVDKPPEQASPSLRRALTWTAVAAAAVGLGAGTTFLLLALSKKGDAEKYCDSGNNCTSQEGVDLRHEAVVRGNIATACFAVGGAGLLAAAGLWFWQPLKASDAVTVGVAPQSITLGGRF